MVSSKILVAVAVLLLPLAGLVFGQGHVGDRRKAASALAKPLLERLNAEIMHPPIAAPEFLLKDLNANRVALRDYRGKLVLVNFWATWCPPCRQEMPLMQVLNKKLANEGLTILGVNLREKPKEVETFSREHQLSFPMLLDEDGQVYDLYKVWSLPTTFIVDENGRLLLLSTVVGIRDWGSEETVNILRALLQQTV